IVDQLHDDNGFADTCATKRADFAPFEKWTDQVDDFDAGGQHLRRGALIHERRGGTMNGEALFCFDRTLLIHWLASDVEYPAHDALTYWHRNGSAGISHFETALESFGAGHGDGTNPIVAEMLLDFEGQLDRLILYLEIHGQRIVNTGK